MSTTAFTSISILLYLVLTCLIARSLVTGKDPIRLPLKNIFIFITLLAAVFHGLVLLDIYSLEAGINLSFFNTAALVMLIMVILLTLTALTKPIEKLGIFIFPLASIILLLKLLFPGNFHVIKTVSWGMDAHIMASILAYSLLNIAAIQALVLAVQERQLRRQPNRLIRALPPLQTMESLLFQMIGIGFFLLTISLLTGFIFLHDIFGQHLAHKSIFSILAWIAFAVLMVGRVRYGWRGQTAIRWTLTGFLALMLAYFGTKMVLELILHKT